MADYTPIDNLFISKYKHYFNLLLVTATPIEQEIMHTHLKPLPGQNTLLKVEYQKHTYYLGVFGAFFAVHVSCGDMGSMARNASTITVSDAIYAWSPSTVIMAGIAFGADKKEQAIGDVLVAERIYSYEQQRIGEETVYRGVETTASSLLTNRFRNVTGWAYEIKDRQAKINIGMMLSGEKLVDDDEFKAELLKQKPGAIGGEMEGVGVYNACDFKVPHFILVKSVCDYADGKKKYKKKARQTIAAKTAIHLCDHVFSAEFAFRDAGLVKSDEVLSTDFTVEHGGIPGWMVNREKLLRKEIRGEN